MSSYTTQQVRNTSEVYNETDLLFAEGRHFTCLQVYQPGYDVYVL